MLSPKLINKINELSENEDKINKFFINVCKKGDLSTVKYLLTTSSLTHKPTLNYDNNEWIRQSCRQGQLDVVQYVLTNPNFVDFDINCRQDVAIRNACLSGNLDLIKFLTQSTLLKKHANINSRENEGFWWLINKKDKQSIEYFSFNADIIHPLIISEKTFNSKPHNGNPINPFINKKDYKTLHLINSIPQLKPFLNSCLQKNPDIISKLNSFQLAEKLTNDLKTNTNNKTTIKI